MLKREIKRIAFLQEYENRPEKLMEVIPEVAEKGYRAVGIAAKIGQEEYIKKLANQAGRYELEVTAFTGYMKYEQAWLKEHPEHRMILSNEGDSEDQDKVVINWGCPFNPEFKKRYFDFLKFLGGIENMSEVWINDEASLGHSSGVIGCYCPLCRNAWRDEFGDDIPAPPFEDVEMKRRFIEWRFNRWNAVHSEMKKVLMEHHSVRAVFLTDPGTCFWKNPWISGVDLAGMLEGIDGFMTDPYYTFHLAWGDKGFLPREVYLGECCRFLRGMAGKEKIAEICTQGFSHPTFIRPLDERDGRFAGIVPLAVGINNVTSYTYLLQKASAMQSSYEESFKLDKYFSQTQPVKFVSIVDSLETQCFDFDGDEDNWHESCMFPFSELCRHYGLPYSYLPSRRLKADGLRDLPVVVLPNVSRLSSEQCVVLRDYVEGGGNLIACGEIGWSEFLYDVFGITSLRKCNNVAESEFECVGKQPAFSDLPWPDEVTGGYSGGTYYPAMGLNRPVKVGVRDDSDVVARFYGDEKLADSPAIIRKSVGKGNVVYVAGIPARLYRRREYGLDCLNFAPMVISRMIDEIAGSRLVLRVRDFPPEVPMKKVRPLDNRNMPTMEFLPCVGENIYLATVASYFKEPFSLTIEARIPNGKKLRDIRELTDDVKITKYKVVDDKVDVDINFGFDDSVKVVGIFFE